MWTSRRRKCFISPVCQWTMVQALTVILNPVYKHCFSVIILDCLLRAQGVAAAPMSEDILNYTSSLLDSLLAEKNYNRQLRPVFGDKPTIITTDIEIRSFGPISESEMTYSMDCYFRQTWIDHRLQFEGARLDVLSMNWKFLQKVWIPDTFFLNGKSSYLHKVTVPNKFIRLRSDGQLKYSMRLTIKADCKMHLRKYPLDTQACPLNIGSFAYPVHEVSFAWKPKNPVVISNDVTLSQYDFLKIQTSNTTVLRREGDRRSVITVHFVIQRRRGYFILQIYAPCAMIVGASWVSFWINRSDAAGRVAVGATTVLTLVTMGFGGRGSLQKAAYATALDWFVIMCFTFVFAALVEYAVVNFIDNREKNMVKTHLEKEREKKKKEEVPEVQADTLEGIQTIAGASVEPGPAATSEPDKEEGIGTVFSQQQPQQQTPQLQQTKSLRGSHPTRLGGLRFPRSRRPLMSSAAPQNKDGFRPRQLGGVVDRYARVCFPMTFLFLNIMYWTLYLHQIDDELDLGVRPEDKNA